MLESTTIMQSARLHMRKLTQRDAEALHPVYANPAVMRYWSSAPHQTLEDTRHYLSDETAPAGHSWAIVLKDSEDAIGTLFASERRQGVFEIGYLLNPDHAGAGIASEAVTTLIGWLFEQPATRKIRADTDPDNVASNRLLERLGFRREGYLRAEWRTHIGDRDTVLWGLLRSEWRYR